MSRSWDGATYDRISSPHVVWSEAILARLELRGDETVLDAGCGSGRVTALLLDQVPDGRVIGVDADADMLGVAAERFDGDDRVTLLQQSLLELDLPEQVDAVYSSATFHWVLDHDELFGRLARAMRPGARMSAQCGGSGNIAHVKSVAERLLQGKDVPSQWLYAGPEETEARMRAVGFESIETWLQPSPVTPPEPLTFLQSVVLGPYVDHMPESDRTPFAQAVLDELGDPPVLDYVRLNIVAQKGPKAAPSVGKASPSQEGS